MRSRLTRLLTGKCKHLETIVVRSAGMERIVCEGCGHVSFSFDATAARIDEVDEVGATQL